MQPRAGQEHREHLSRLDRLIAANVGKAAAHAAAFATCAGALAAKGLADELRDRGCLVIDGTHGKARYVALNACEELESYPIVLIAQTIQGSHRCVADETLPGKSRCIRFPKKRDIHNRPCSKSNH
ncbi:DUF3363 domain-containing protein [Verticiella sediminum]|uniref:DUF3363 domain-containing protein n=1 Tax=Verticiella sediminum TaxID=1247510 RepID=A0A556A9L0_9BURK|nr:DUF3363 domain-containing protein [Verticiella sediminum]